MVQVVECLPSALSSNSSTTKKKTLKLLEEFNIYRTHSTLIARYTLTNTHKTFQK
jgi:hypothetical protein